MSSTLKVTLSATFTDADGNTRTIDNGRSGVTLTLTNGEADDGIIGVAASGTETVWTASDYIGAFAGLVLIALDEDLQLELITDDDNSVGEEFATFILKEGIPFVLGSDDSFANYTSPFTGTIDSIESIKVKNPSSNAARLKFLICQ